MKVKKGSIWVRLEEIPGQKLRDEHYAGAFLKAIQDSEDSICYGVNLYVFTSNARPASTIEIQAYIGGIKNVNEIVNPSEFKKGDIVHFTHGRFSYIFVYETENKTKTLGSTEKKGYIDTYRKLWNNVVPFEYTFYKDASKLATPEEVIWFVQCQKLDKYISKEEALKKAREEMVDPLEIIGRTFIDSIKYTRKIIQYSNNKKLYITEDGTVWTSEYLNLMIKTESWVENKIMRIGTIEQNEGGLLHQKIYKHENGSIVLWDNNLKDSYYFINSNGIYSNNIKGGYPSTLSEYSEASQIEKIWLRDCMEAKKLVDKPTEKPIIVGTAGHILQGEDYFRKMWMEDLPLGASNYIISADTCEYVPPALSNMKNHLDLMYPKTVDECFIRDNYAQIINPFAKQSLSKTKVKKLSVPDRRFDKK